MTKTLLRLLFLFLLLTPAGFAQQIPSWEIFGGYSFERSSVREYFKPTPTLYVFRERYINFNGFEFAVTENVNRWFGGTFQATGHFKSPVVLGTTNKERHFTFLYGPRFSHRMAWGTPYAHLLFGIGRGTVSVSPGPHAEENTFALAGGVGFDLNLGSKAAVRVLQLQYSPMNQVASKNHQFQASTGIVLRLGQEK